MIPCVLWCGIAGELFFCMLVHLLCAQSASLVTGGGALYHLSRATAEVFSPAISRWIISCYALTLSTNLLSTLLLAYRIWTLDQQTSRVRVTKSKLRPLMSIVIDSGFLYSFTLVAAIACFTSESHGQNVVLDLVSLFSSFVPDHISSFTICTRSHPLSQSLST